MGQRLSIRDTFAALEQTRERNLIHAPIRRIYAVRFPKMESIASFAIAFNSSALRFCMGCGTHTIAGSKPREDDCAVAAS